MSEMWHPPRPQMPLSGSLSGKRSSVFSLGSLPSLISSERREMEEKQTGHSQTCVLSPSWYQLPVGHE